MNQLATCLRCSAPLTEGNAQAINPNVCISCLGVPGAVPATTPTPTVSKRTCLYGLCAAALVLGLAPLVGVALRGKLVSRVPSSDERVAAEEPAAQPAAVQQAADQPDDPVRSYEDYGATRPIRLSDRLAPPELVSTAGARRDGAEKPVVRPRADKSGSKLAMKRRNFSEEEDLLAQLSNGEEVGLGAAGSKVMATYVSHVEKNQGESGSKGAADVSPVLQLRPDLSSLPLRDGPASTLTSKAATELQTRARKMRAYLNTISPVGQDGRRISTALLGEQLREEMRGKKPDWLRPEAVPALNQMLMAEDAPVRKILVEILAAIPGKKATVALAGRAAFDTSPDVRAAAVAALKGRDPEHWRPVLVYALRYPWAPPADFASEALVNLKDKDAVPELVVMLKLPPAGRPYRTADRRVVIREVVRINHVTNCLLCHPPVLRGDELAQGVDPMQSIPQQITTNRPVLTQAVQNLTRTVGTFTPVHDYGGRLKAEQSQAVKTTVAVKTNVKGNQQTVVRFSVPVLIRADITFLRQDFSVGLPVPTQRGPQGPAVPGGPATRVAPPVRFDYVVRTRMVTPAEWKWWKAQEETTDRQREAVLFALRELTGRDEGETTKAWVKAYPLAEAEVRSKRHAETLVRTEGIERTALIGRHRDGEGMEHTWALSRSIPKLSGLPQELARSALVKRLSRASAAELRKHLADRDVEVCRAAVLACAGKDDAELVERLAALLDADATTAKLAATAMNAMTGHDLPDAAAWRAWLADVAGE
jgi:hypothetical protein